MQVHVLEETNKFNAAASIFANPYSAAYTQKSADLPAAVGHVPSKPHITTSGTLGPQRPSPQTTVLLPDFSKVHSHCPSPGSQLILRLSTKLPAELKTCGCATLSSNPHSTLAWRSGSQPLPAVALRGCLTICLTDRLPSIRGDSPSHSSPSSSKVKFNYWVI